MAKFKCYSCGATNDTHKRSFIDWLLKFNISPVYPGEAELKDEYKTTVIIDCEKCGKPNSVKI